MSASNILFNAAIINYCCCLLSIVSLHTTKPMIIIERGKTYSSATKKIEMMTMHFNGNRNIAFALSCI